MRPTRMDCPAASTRLAGADRHQQCRHDHPRQCDDHHGRHWVALARGQRPAPFRVPRRRIPMQSQAAAAARLSTFSSCWGVHQARPRVLLHDQAAIASLTRCMGMDHAHQNIRVDAVCPDGVAPRCCAPASPGAASIPIRPSRNSARPCRSAALRNRRISPRSWSSSHPDAARYMCGALVEVNGGKPVGWILHGKIALVTSSRSGIGKAISRRLRGEGAHVFTAQRRARTPSSRP